MRACVLSEFGSVDNLEVREISDPVPGPGEVLVDVHASGVSYADRLVIEGKYQVLPSLPFVPGKEIAGVIAALGPGVRRLQLGMRVLGLADSGAYAQRAVIPQDSCFVIPESMPFVDAAAMGLAHQTAHIALMERGGFRRGDSVLVTGASGGVGLAAIQIARAKGAVVLAGLSNPSKSDAVKLGGAHHIIDLSVPDLNNSLRDQVYSVTSGRGVDIVLDVIGGDVFEAGLRALGWRGRAVVIGFVGERIPSVRTNYLLIKNISVSGMYWGSYPNHAPEAILKAHRDLVALYEAGQCKPVVMRRCRLSDVREAFGYITRREVLGRVLLEP